MKRRIAISLIAFAASACQTRTEPVYLRNMAGMTVQCGPYSNRLRLAAASAQRESQCIGDYQRQGYERTPRP